MLIQLRDVTPDDLPIFFEFQLDPDANYMAAFTAKDPSDREAFDTHWEKILGSEAIAKKTILFKDNVVGYLLQFHQFGHTEVAYWIDKDYWGKGIATQALTAFLTEIDIHPLYARAAKDNLGSIRVLEKCGFRIDSEDKGYANARGKEIEEYVLKLDLSTTS
ncbi:MAG: GNAT family N-acetyltransferase [Chloroflexi bacterium]|nr:GNAT family N-acetyltransferase [Chloroflexota bacterium]